MSVSRIKLCKDGPTISRLVMGTWRLLDEPALNPQKLLSLIESCVEAGITTFDEADIYGDYGSEELMGKAISIEPSLRDRIEVISKCGIQLVSEKRPKSYIKHYNTSKNHIINTVDHSLRNMGVEHLDVLLLHRPDFLMQPDEVAEAFHLLNEHGKVFHFGVSNFTVRQFELLQSRCNMPLVTNQLEISLSQRNSMLNGDIDLLMQQKKSPMAWSPLGSGALLKQTHINRELHSQMKKISQSYHGASREQIALAWLLKHPSQIVPVLGTRKSERIKELVEAEQIHLSRQDWYALWVAAGGEVP